jgi:hypothetical protein
MNDDPLFTISKYGMFDSKPRFNTFALFTALLFVNVTAKAQQAKAYETVHYRAKAGDLLFLLSYTDGYISASRISLRLNGQKTLLFLPESGTSESNGDFNFVSQPIAHNGDIRLMQLNEEETAPALIRSSYRAKGRTVVLIFKRPKG